MRDDKLARNMNGNQVFPDDPVLMVSDFGMMQRLMLQAAAQWDLASAVAAITAKKPLAQSGEHTNHPA